MSPQRLDEILRDHRSTKARFAYLTHQLEFLQRSLAICERHMVSDQVSLSQAITGMPHGSSVGDPVGRLAIDIASGEVSDFVKEIREDIAIAEAERMKLGPELRVVETVMGALGERQWAVLEMKKVECLSWVEIISGMNRKFGTNYSKRSLQRLLDTAFSTACSVVR